MLLKFIVDESMYYLEFYYFSLYLFLFFFLSRLRDLSLRAVYINKFVHFLYLAYFLSSGLQPKHPQILQPDDGSLVFLTLYGTWHRHDLLFLENAFMQFLQQPFRASNSDVSFLIFFFYPGWYSGSSPRLIKSSLEHPLQPHVWHPCVPNSVLLWSKGTTQTHAFLFVSVCLQILQHYALKFIYVFISLF